MTSPTPAATEDHRSRRRRAEAVLGGPFWWACHLGVSYWLIPRLCVWGTRWPVHVLTVVTLALIARAVISGRQLVRSDPNTTGGPGAVRDVFLGWVGLAMSVFFAAVVVAEWLPSLFLDPCW